MWRVVEEKLADRKFKTPGLFERTQFQRVEDFDCPISYVSRHAKQTKLGHWRSEYRSLRRLGLRAYRLDREWRRQMRESMQAMMQATMRAWSADLARQTEQRSNILTYLTEARVSQQILDDAPRLKDVTGV